MRSEAAFGPAPKVVDHARRTDRRNGRTVDDAHFPADQRQAQPVEVDAEWSACVHRVHELTSAVDEAGEVPTGWTVPERQLALLDAEPCASRVDRHPDLAPEARRKRKASLPRG